MTKLHHLGPVMGDLKSTELLPEEAAWLTHPLIGGVILFSRNYRDRKQLTALMRDIRQLRPDILVAVDTEGGRVQRFREGFTRLPPLAVYGEIYERDPALAIALAEQGGQVLAAELAEFDVDLPFSPVVDLNGGVSAIIGDRAIHRDAAIVAELATAHMQGLHKGGLATTAKHFPGHGAVAPDSHEELPVDERSFEQIKKDDLRPYEAALNELDSVMAAHVVYPAVDTQPASFSQHWLQQVLRQDMGFAGVIFADDLSMGGALEQGEIEERAAKAFAAGCDMLPVCNRPDDLARLLANWDCSEPSRGHPALSALRRKAVFQHAPETAYQALHAAGLITATKPPEPIKEIS